MPVTIEQIAIDAIAYARKYIIRRITQLESNGYPEINKLCLSEALEEILRELEEIRNNSCFT